MWRVRGRGEGGKKIVYTWRFLTFAFDSGGGVLGVWGT